MSLADSTSISPAVSAPVNVVAPDEAPLILTPGELRQLWQAYYELLELHRAEVVDDESFETAHQLLVDQVLPLRKILRDREHLVVDPYAPVTF